MQSEFGVTVRTEAGATVIVVRGELDLATSPELEHALEQAFAANAVLAILDLRELDFMDSSGLNVLVKARQAAAECGTQLCVVKGVPQVQRLLTLTGVAERLTIIDAPEDALHGS